MKRTKISTKTISNADQLPTKTQIVIPNKIIAVVPSARGLRLQLGPPPQASSAATPGTTPSHAR